MSIVKKMLIASLAVGISFVAHANVPDWLIGTWAYEDFKVAFTEETISVIEGNLIVSKGTYTLEGEYIRPEWEDKDHKEGDEDGLIADSYNKKVYIEGGPWLEKFATDNNAISREDFGLNNVANSYVISSKPYVGNLIWAYGVWQLKDTRARIYITPFYITEIGVNDDFLDGKDIKEVDKKWGGAKTELNELIGLVVRIGSYYLDTSSQLVYSFDGIDKKTYLQKTEDYELWKLIAIVALILAIVISIVILLVRLIVNLIKKIVLKVKEISQKAKLAAKEIKKKMEEKAAAKKQYNKKGWFIGIVVCAISLIFIVSWCGGSERKGGGSGGNNGSASKTDYSWIDGRWRLSVGGEYQIIDFDIDRGCDFGTYTFTIGGGYGRPYMEIGNFTINGNSIKLQDASAGGSISYVYIEGRQLHDGSGHYYSR